MGNEPLVKFYDDSHEYYVGDVKAYSVTTIVGSFLSDFDKEYWTLYKAVELLVPDMKVRIKNKKFRYPYNYKPKVEYLLSLVVDFKDSDLFSAKKEIRDEWIDNANCGSALHNRLENALYEKGEAVNEFDGMIYPVEKWDKKYDNQSLIDDLSKLKWGAYPELLVWGKFNGVYVTGQIDLPFISPEKEVFIRDYKTTSPRKKYSKAKGGKAKKPFNHLDTGKHCQYTAQVSMYMYLLENFGYSCGGLAIDSFSDYDETKRKVFETQYLRDDVVKMIDIFTKSVG